MLRGETARVTWMRALRTEFMAHRGGLLHLGHCVHTRPAGRGEQDKDGIGCYPET